MLTDLADVLRAANQKVVELPGWKTRGRAGAFNPRGVLCHHTAGSGDGYADANWLATVGRPDLNPPLAQLALSRNGTWYVLAAGRANHAGKCRAVGGLTAGDGNEQMIGVEAQNRGTDAEGWTPAQYDAYVAGVAAITTHYGWRAPLGHKETSLSGKTDPDFSMDRFRRDVAAKQEEDDMPSAQEIADAVWAHKVTLPDGNGEREAGRTLGGANLYSYRAAKALGATELAAALAKALPATGGVTQAQLEAALRTVLGSVDD